MNYNSFFVTEELTPYFETFTKIVGVTKNNEKGIPIQYLLRKLTKNAFISFKPEPTNPYDPNAIKVYANDIHIGYLNKELANNISYFLKNNPNYILVGKIIEITGNTLNKGCNIKIFFKPLHKANKHHKTINKTSNNKKLYAYLIYSIIMAALIITVFNVDSFLILLGMLLLIAFIGMLGIFFIIFFIH